MRIPWKMKSIAFTAIDGLGAPGLLYWFQKNISRRSRIAINEVHPDWSFHEANINQSPGKRLIEFGAGKSLAQNLYLSHLGIDQTVVDITPMLDVGLASEAARQISALTGRKLASIESVEDLNKAHIKYIAPLDMTNSGFQDDTFDVCISTNTFEHIPRKQIVSILHELKRVLCPGGLISAQIDYTDHYSHTDPSIGRLNFLRYSEKEFRKYNHPSHYQNRLRHQDYLTMFEDAGFSIISAKPTGFAAEKELSVLKADDKRRQDPDILAVGGKIVVKNEKM